MTNDEQTSFRLPADMLAFLRKQDTARYIRESIRRRRRQIQQAQDHLDWTKPEVSAALDALEGHTWTFELPRTESIARALEGAQDDIAASWGIGPDRWTEMYETVRQSEPTARALCILAREAHSTARTPLSYS